MYNFFTWKNNKVIRIQYSGLKYSINFFILVDKTIKLYLLIF